MNRDLIELILEIHSDAELYATKDILIELHTRYPKNLDIRECMLEEGICLECYEDLRVSYKLDYPVLICDDCGCVFDEI